jgi:hypothetical protein
MTWLTWRQLRAQALAAYAAVAACALVLALTGPGLPDLPDPVYDLLTPTDKRLFNAGLAVMAVAPALVGAFWGAPMVARELEAGTHRLAWMQGVTRTRWLATKLGITVVATAAAIGLLSLAVTWWSSGLDGVRGNERGGLAARLTPVSFAMRGIVPIGYAVFALVLGVVAGIVLRRSVAAIALTLAVFTFVQVAMPLWVRPHLAPPVRQELVISSDTVAGIGIRENGQVLVEARTTDPGDWVLSNRTVDGAGRVATVPAWLADCMPGPRGEKPADGRAVADACFARLTADGYRQEVVSQPAGRFWRLQWTETGIFLVLSALLAWYGFRRVRQLS